MYIYLKGEGEIKIIRDILHKQQQAPNSNGRFLIFGSDADLILLALCCQCRNLFLLADQREANLLSVDKLERCMLSKFKFKIQNAAQLRFDFTLIALLAGNDYLPKLRQTKLV